MPPWEVLIPALQAVLTSIIQAVGQRHASMHDTAHPDALQGLEPEHKEAIQYLATLVQQAPTP
jgi:hypothetical protein